jgi:hypothetical protein
MRDARFVPPGYRLCDLEVLCVIEVIDSRVTSTRPDEFKSWKRDTVSHTKDIEMQQSKSLVFLAQQLALKFSIVASPAS